MMTKNRPPIDRIAPTRRPSGPVRGYQQWRSLLFMHWEVPVDEMRQVVPENLDLDLFDGKAYIGVVPFLMQGVRPAWSPKAFGFRFLELNVRTYVHFNGRPGVYFFSLDAASRLAVWAARKFWGLPYFNAQMEMKREGEHTIYSSKRPSDSVGHSVRYQQLDALPESSPDSFEFFLLERYLLFVERKAQIYVGQVHHAPYPAYAAEVLECEDSLVNAAGLHLDMMPEYAHYSPGVDVKVFDLSTA